MKPIKVVLSFVITVFSICLNADTARSTPTALTLIENGQAKAAIIVPSDELESRHGDALDASKVLNDNLQAMAGTTLPVLSVREIEDLTIKGDQITGAETGKLPQHIESFVVIGDGAIAQKLGFTVSGLGPGGVLIETRGNVLALLGSTAPGDRKAPRWAVNTLLEMLGFRNLWPGPLGKIVPKRKTVRIEPVRLSYSPRIKQRNIRPFSAKKRGAAFLGYDPKRKQEISAKAYAGNSLRDWFNWHCLGGDLGIHGGHAFGSYWEKYGKQHPEWFALQKDGTRSQEGTGTRERLCVSNPDLIQHIADEIIIEAKADPRKKSFSLSPNDGGYSSFCMCDKCRALDVPDAPKVTLCVFEKVGKGKRHNIEYPSLTDRYVYFWNEIAKRVTAENPDLLLVCDAYNAYKLAPVKRKANPNLVLRYVSSYLDQWDGWKKAGVRRVFWRPNIFHWGTKDGQLCLYPHYLAKVFAKLAKEGALALDADSICNNWALHGLNYYVMAKLSWDPCADVDQMIDDYCEKGFGKSAPQIKEYFTVIENSFKPGSKTETEKTLSPQIYPKLEKCLDEAMKKAENETVKQRIAFLRRGLEVSRLIAEIDREYKSSQGRGHDQKLRQLMKTYIQLARDITDNHILAVNFSPIYCPFYRSDAWHSVLGEEKRTRLQEQLKDASQSKNPDIEELLE